MAQLGDFNAPIPIPGGQRIGESDRAGSLSLTTTADRYSTVAVVKGGGITSVGNNGITGTFLGGISVIDIINGGQSIINNIRTFGTASDGTPFLLDESGLGSSADDFARLTVTAGGNLANLENQFIVTEATLAADRKSVMTVGYLVLDK
ncbi:MAG: hypothetical protein Q9218_003524 [Villophora microphyllina]